MATPSRRQPGGAWLASLALALVSSSSLVGCGGDSWYRAERGVNGGYFIVRAGLDDDSCLVLYVAEPPAANPFSSPDGTPHEPLTQVGVELAGHEDALVWATKLDLGADRCLYHRFVFGPLPVEGTPITQGAGTLRFVEVTTDLGERVCEVELEASLEGWVLDETVAISRGGCPQPEAEPFEVDVLGASSPSSRDNFLALRSWNEDRGVCYGLDLWLFEDPWDEPGQDEGLSLPESWELTQATMVMFDTEEACRTGESSSTSESELHPVWLLGETDSARGYLRFDASQPWINPLDDTPTPCEISVDISVDFDPLMPWTPTTLRFVAEGVEVARTCGRGD